MSKKLLILYSHWPPSNLAGVHRARLIGNMLHKFDWDVQVITVHEDFYEETLDHDLEKLVSPNIKVHKVDARPVSGLRVYGDIVLRARTNLIDKAIEVINDWKPDFMWVPIPSFYMGPVARKVFDRTGIPYGIDYIDPWVDGFTDARKFGSRGWLSNVMAKRLEPVSVKKASLISGVAKAYYQPVLDRNFAGKEVIDVAMPYGFDPGDHKVHLDNIEFPWAEDEIGFVYAGAFLPKSRTFVQQLFRAFSKLLSEGKVSSKVKLCFLGTGFYAGKTILEYAIEAGVDAHVHEVHDRLPFLYILNLLGRARGVMVIGSTEAHYTASKTFQSVLSERPLFAMLHKESSAVTVLNDANAADYVVTYEDGMTEERIGEACEEVFGRFLNVSQEAEGWKPNFSALDKYSSEASARILVDGMERAIELSKKRNG